MVSNPRHAERLGWGLHLQAIGVLVGAAATGAGDPVLAVAVAGWQKENGLAVDGVIGPNTWKLVKVALSPPAAPTGVLPGLPPVPHGFEGVIATFGDPRPLMGNGSLSKENAAIWERRTLAKGTLPFSIPLDPKRPTKGVKTTFYAHRKLVPAFVGVFEEIARLGLQPHVHSWGGIYNFRPIRGAKKAHLSLHCFGAAIDLNSESNALNTDGDMHPGIVEVFEQFGFLWGGNFGSRPDPMHFQYATGY
jgi:hypothetical protein